MRKLMLTAIGLLVLTAVASAQAPPSLPKQVDLKPEFDRFGLTAREQGGRGTCSLFAVAALADLEYAKSAGKAQRPFSEEYLVWATQKATGQTGDAAPLFKAVHALNLLGICTENFMPYSVKREDPVPGPSVEAKGDAKNHAGRWKVHWIRRLDSKTRLTDGQMLAIKRILAAGHPVASSLRWPKKLKGSSLLDVPAADEVSYGHSVALVGYTDDDQQPGGGVFRLRNSWSPRWGSDGYGLVSYAYVRAYLHDAVWLQYGAAHSEEPLTRFEAETLPVLQKHQCETRNQDMKPFDRLLWSAGKQLFCVAKKGGWVELGFTVAKAGRFRLRALGTAAPDYGRVRVALDGKTVPRLFDLYCERVTPSGSLELGTHQLAAGRHTLRFTVVGKSEASTNYYFGIDAIDLLAAN
jgi:hypothetical protein